MTQDELQKRIRSLTKQIGVARREHQREELSNLRAQREAFARQLIEEYETFYIIKDGRTQFVNREEMEEHYSDPDERKKVKGAGMVQAMFQQRQTYKKRLDWALSATDEEIRKYVIEAYKKETDKFEEWIHNLQEEIGEEKMDFALIDERNEEADKLLEGIDFASLMDKNDDDEES